MVSTCGPRSLVTLTSHIGDRDRHDLSMRCLKVTDMMVERPARRESSAIIQRMLDDDDDDDDDMMMIIMLLL